MLIYCDPTISLCSLGMITSFIKFLLHPFTTLGLLLAALGAVVFLKKERPLKWLAVATAGWFVIISTPLVPTLIMRSLEQQYQPVRVRDLPVTVSAYNIIVLGGGHGFDENLPANSLLSSQALGRLSEGIRLHRLLPHSKLVLSGFSASGGVTQAEMLRNVALLLGVPRQDIILQKKPANTYEEARAYASTFGSTHPLIVVTSAYHMPRAMYTFSKAGINAIASPANYRLIGHAKYAAPGLPDAANVENFHIAVVEWAGLAWYHLMY